MGSSVTPRRDFPNRENRNRFDDRIFEGGESIQLEKLYNKTVRYLQNHPIEIHYAPPPGPSGAKP